MQFARLSRFVFLLGVGMGLAELASAVGPIMPAPTQPNGALTGRIVFTSGGHGWTWSGSSWILQRPVLAGMCEDFGNVDQMTLFAFYCFNAGATVVPMRPIGNQTNEVVLDNDDAGVTFNGSWSNSSFTNYYGSPGDVPYRFASVAATETATATYTPNIPVAGFYPVYTWAAHGTNRTSQLYRIRHTGGEATVRVPHYMVGNGWVYLGTYYFNAGSNSANGAVVISNLQPTPGFGSVVIADAIRFGNGMGTIDRGGGVSDYPREEECSRYWVQNSLGQGQPTSIYDDPGLSDQNDNVGTPPRMAREMNREDSGNIYKRIFITFHSNATSGDTNTATARGTLALYNTDVANRTPNQIRLAQIAGQGVNDEMTNLNALLEVPWADRSPNTTLAGTYGEINGNSIGNEMDCTLIEVAFHDNTSDVKLLRDPKARSWVARAAYHAVLKYMNEFDGLATNFFPEPPHNARAVAVSNGIRISWSTPIAQAGSGAANGYVVYQSTNGYGFGNLIGVSGGGTTSLTITNLAVDTDYYFRVAATNAGGESFSSEVVGCRRSLNPAAMKLFFVNGFERFDRTENLRQTPTTQNYGQPGNTGTIDRVMPRANNSFDYVVQHGKAISAAGWAFDSCQRASVTNNQIALTNYPIVIWAAGQETNVVLPGIVQTQLTTFLGGGGNLFISGADIAWSLGRSSGPSAADRIFLTNQLHCAFTNDANNSSGNYNFSAASGSIFTNNTSGSFDDGTKSICWVQAPDVLTPVGSGASAALNYGSGTGIAGVQYNGTAGGGKVVFLGFPFETITSATARNDYMADILSFLTPPPPPAITSQPQSLTVVQGSNATFSVAVTSTTSPGYQWRFNSTNISGATMSSYVRTNAQAADIGSFSVVVTNAGGSVTSSNALLTVLPSQPPLFDAVVSLPDHRVKLILEVAPGFNFSIQASSDLVNWLTITNVAGAPGLFEFIDANSTNFPRRFYRASSP